ncbi:hypothetical protein MPSEU_000301800 [Mayamaea pseudoterrestris]|nr:hypothetical protein MPSEU_000301800 [Mayamaea pseudoterrestris]
MPKKETDTMKILPCKFQPCDKDVVFGRGSISMHPGNRSFRKLVADKLQDYLKTTTKVEKGMILRSIVAQVRMDSPHGGFVKKDISNGRWYEVGDFLAREKTSQTFRDALFDHYRSSNTAKKLRRRLDQNVEHPHRSCSAISVTDFDGSISMDDNYADCRHRAPPLLRDHDAIALAHSCPDLGRNDEISGVSTALMHNHDWYSPLYSSSKVGSTLANVLQAKTCHQSSARSIMDFAVEHQASSGCFDWSFSSMGHTSRQFGGFNNSAFKSNCLQQISLTPGASMFTRNDVHSDPTSPSVRTKAPREFPRLIQSTDDTFERLLSVAGNFSVEGDPFEPHSITYANENSHHVESRLFASV